MKSRPFVALLGIPLSLLLLAGPAAGQWSNDPALNLALADRANDQVQPKIVGTSDGGCYISWFDNATGGYDVYLQRLDARGYEQWPHNGILIADRSYGWTTDYGLAVDAANNALLTYNDDRVNGDQIGCNKISPAGTLLWGPTGVRLTNTSEFVASPRVTVTSDGYYVVGWVQESGFYLQKLQPNGMAVWATAVHVAPATGSYNFSELKAADNGSVIVSWVYYPNQYLYAQKYSAAGMPLWGLAPKIVFNGGGLQFGYFPTFALDGTGGAIFSWYETNSPRNAYVQHIGPTGLEVFPHNGVAVSTLTGRIRLDPSVAYNAATHETFVFWTEANVDQTVWGLYGQKITASGTRMWTNNGIVLLPLTPDQNGFVQTVLCETGAIVIYSDNPGTTTVAAFRVGSTGNNIWANSPRTISNALPGEKWDTQVALTPAGMVLATWVDGRSGDESIYAQNLKLDGTIGLPIMLRGDLNCDGGVDFGDINPFVAYISNCANWQQAYPNCPAENGDVDGDGLNACNGYPFDDINPFVALLSQ
jgi:hypothetical protein